MSGESTPWKIVAIVVALLTVSVPAYVAYDIYGRGPTPEKRIQLTQLTPINPLGDLSALGDKATISLTIEKQKINNLVIVRAWLDNNGGVPILPADFYEKLSVNVDNPWKIVAIENNAILPQYIRLRWARVSNTRFEAEPTLLNPGDRVDATIYLTDTEFDAAASPATVRKEPLVTWNARIVNLRGFSNAPDLFARGFGEGFGIEVRLSGWALPFTLFAALFFQALYLRLLFRAGFLRAWSWPSTSLVLCATLLAFAAAESSATYLFPDFLKRMVGVQHWLNAPVIIVHVLVLLFLYWKAQARSSH